MIMGASSADRPQPGGLDPHAWPSLRPAGVLGEVVEERARQDAKWGEQNHPDIPDALKGDRERAAHALGILRAPDAKRATDSAAKAGEVSWLHIAIEELAEALDEAAWGNEDALRTEVVQLAAVCVQWAQAIDRRARRAIEAGTVEDLTAARALGGAR